MESYRPLAASPELQQDWSQPQEERSATWPELFTVSVSYRAFSPHRAMLETCRATAWDSRLTPVLLLVCITPQDLFFVAAISNLSHLFKEHPVAPNAGEPYLNAGSLSTDIGCPASIWHGCSMRVVAAELAHAGCLPCTAMHDMAYTLTVAAVALGAAY